MGRVDRAVRGATRAAPGLEHRVLPYSTRRGDWVRTLARRPPRGGRAAAADIAFVIAGVPRSGTTLVQRLACEIPEVRVSPETHFLAHLPAILRRCRFPLDADAIREEVSAFLRLGTSKDMSLDAEAVVDDLGGACRDPWELYAIIVRRLGGAGSIHGDKTADHQSYWRALARAFPRLKVIGVVRDPRAVVASRLEVPWVRKREGGHVLAADAWCHFQRLAATAEKRLGSDRVLALRYEDVVADPSAARSAIARFLGANLPAEGQMTPQDASFVLPWETWKARALEPVTPERLNAWTSSLTPSDAGDVAAVCRALMIRHGYDPGMGRAAAAVRRAGFPVPLQISRARHKAVWQAKSAWMSRAAR